MTHQFVHQPYDDGYDLRDFFKEVAHDTAFDNVSVVVAWAKRTGLEALRPSMEILRDRGVSMRIIVGISQGGTSRQGLAGVADVADEAFVFHLPGRTFHPKVYLAASDTEALALVGSHNLTAGGAGRNFEAGTLSRLDLDIDEDRTYYESIRTYVDALLDDSAVCMKLDDTSMASLLDNPRYWLSDEDQPAVQSGEPNEEGPTDPGGTGDDFPSLFGSSQRSLRNIPYSGTASAMGGASGASSPTASSGGAPTGAGSGTSAAGSQQPTSTASSDTPAGAVSKRWYKKLGAIDAQHPSSPDGHPSNTMTLVAHGHPIDTATYFREDFFGDAVWAPAMSGGGKAREIATIPCEVFDNGASLGTYHFVLRHTPDYESSQSNRLTELRWGDLAAHMKATSHAGDYATVEKLTDGSYRLHFGPNPAGSFIP